MTPVTRQQAEAMDEAAEWAARAHPLPFPPISREPLPTRTFAPGVIDGPYTSDAQAHHEWEDLERVASDGWAQVRPWIKATALACFLAPMATPNCSTVGQSNCSRQDGVIMRGLR